MNKIGFSGMKSLDQLRSLSGYVPGTSKTIPTFSRSSSDSISLGGFANLKLTAEKLVKEQASVKTDLEMANSKLKKSMAHILALEEKLQNAINENAKLKVKQKEDAKLWKGLESKFSSTKTLCDQLTETLQHLACQVRDAEQDKKLFEDKLLANSKAFDSLHLQMTELSAKLESAEENKIKCEQELTELKIEKGELEKAFLDEKCRTANLMEEKDALIKELEGSVASNKLCLERLNSRLEEVQHELSLKEDICKCLRATQENLEKEKSCLQLRNEDLAKSLLASGQEIKGLEDLIRDLVEKLTVLDKHSMVVSNNVTQLKSVFDTCYKLLQQEKELIAKQAQRQFDRLQDQFLHITSENGAFRSANEELKNKVLEFQKAQEFFMVQHAEECRLAEEENRRLESEAKLLVSKKTDLETLVSKLEEEIEHFSEASSLSENKMQELLLKISTLESENKDIQNKLQLQLQGKAEEIETLQKEILRHEQHVDSLEKQVSQLRDSLEEKEQLQLQFKDREKQLEDQRTEIQASLAGAESTLAEAKKQYDLMLESKQLELSKHLKEISQRNDQAINDIRRKFDLEKQEIVNLEKEKADKLVREMERKYDQKLAENKEESRQYLLHVQEEHDSLNKCIQQEHDKKVSDLRANHNEELKCIQLQAENASAEKSKLLKREHEIQMRALKQQHEDECRKLEEELELQKSKEERQRALLQLQWKVMDDNPKADQEANSKKSQEYSISSIKKRDPDGGNRSQRTLIRPENEEKVMNKTDSPFLRATQTPVANILKKVENVNTGSTMVIPKHSRKVTHREYEVETSNGRTITKRRKTKSTVMFGDHPTKQKRMATPKAKTSKDVKVTKGGSRSHPTNIGDLFTEGSLNPYADDPYAFD